MGSRDHACETCGRGGMNDDRACVCGRRDLSEVVECARCRTLLAQCNCPKGWLENRALWVAAERRALAAEAELTAARETVAKLEREKAEAWEKVHEARDKADSRLADEANIDRLAAYLGAGFDEATPRVIVDEVLGRLSAALARVAAMEPVVAACIARAEANDAQEAAKSNGAFAEEFMRWCDADDELGRRVDTFRSTSKPQEPTSE
jgi:hypothetical protein